MSAFGHWTMGSEPWQKEKGEKKKKTRALQYRITPAFCPEAILGQRYLKNKLKYSPAGFPNW